MKTIITIAAAFLVMTPSFGQGLQPRRMLGTRAARPSYQSPEEHFHKMYPSETNEFGRTYAQQRDFDRERLARMSARTTFDRENSSGKDRFGRGFEECYEYERNFALKTFLGFEFKKKYKGDYEVSLRKPYRLFDTARLDTTPMNRLFQVSLVKKVENITMESLSNEVFKIAENIGTTYKINFYPVPDGSYNLGKYRFESEAFAFNVCGVYNAQNGRGQMQVEVCRKNLYSEDSKRRAEEIRKKVEAKGMVLNIASDKDAELLTASEPNVASPSTNETEATRRLELLGRSNDTPAVAHLSAASSIPDFVASIHREAGFITDPEAQSQTGITLDATEWKAGQTVTVSGQKKPLGWKRRVISRIIHPSGQAYAYLTFRDEYRNEKGELIWLTGEIGLTRVSAPTGAIYALRDEITPQTQPEDSFVQ